MAEQLSINIVVQCQRQGCTWFKVLKGLQLHSSCLTKGHCVWSVPELMIISWWFLLQGDWRLNSMCHSESKIHALYYVQRFCLINPVTLLSVQRGNSFKIRYVFKQVGGENKKTFFFFFTQENKMGDNSRILWPLFLQCSQQPVY